MDGWMDENLQSVMKKRNHPVHNSITSKLKRFLLMEAAH